ncbi:hypothetical protein [Mucisphaera sp.]|uniref:hypothetical protein n=1 Tax=Mucisphaera sp. TaxID=2913024 RepID=UPI003D123F21
MKPGRPSYNGLSNIDPLRRRMVAETNHFLNLALRGDIHTPRIPTRKVDEGGFGMLKNNIMGQLLVRHFWRSWINRDDDLNRRL